MSGALRLTLFGLVLAAVFAAAAALGRAVGPLERGSADADVHGGMRERPAETALPGLAVAADGLRLEADRTTLRRGRRVPFTFRILRRSQAVRRFDVEQERQMHLIVVRRDLVGFEHVHPRMLPDGRWTTALRFHEGGAYRAFADFSTGGRRTTLGVDLFVRGEIAPRLPVVDRRPVRAGPFSVALAAGQFRAGTETALRFRVSRAGRPARVGRYLGARGHLVLLRAGDLAYVHTHADRDALAFETEFPSAGGYRAFLQFRAGGRVRTAAFTLRVLP